MASTLTSLYRRDKGICHYCFCHTNRTPGSSRQATKEHIVPRSHGGGNSMDNYVLACSSCNNRRGNMLFFCKCSLCTTLIDRALNTDRFIKYVFDQIITFNKVKVYRSSGVWVAKRGYAHRHFDTFAEAINYAEHGSFRKGE